MSIESLSEELISHYRRHSYDALGGADYRPPFVDLMEEWAAANPELGPMRQKAAQYEIIAENFQPVIFVHSPFYGEMGVKVAEYDGVPGLGSGGWLFQRNAHLFRDDAPDEFEQYLAGGKHGVHLTYGPYVDYDHHCFPYSNVLENGLKAIYEQTQAELKNCRNKEEVEFIENAARGLLSVKLIGEKFAAAAAERLKRETANRNRFLDLIAKTAGEVPWRAPETFYEALAAIWFLHEICASIEGIGMSVIGHVDRLTGAYLRRDLKDGRLTLEEGEDLIRRFLLHTDRKVDQSKPVTDCFNRQEQGDTLILGGRDENGDEIRNEVTFMILRSYRELGLIYPKIHCRIDENSRTDFLDAINQEFLDGRNVISLLSDAAIISAQTRAGKRLEDAANYVAGGCWEVIVEGCEHSAGANCYFNLARVIDMSIHASPEVESATGYVCDTFDHAQSFEEVYQIVMGNIARGVRRLAAFIEKNGQLWPRVSPAPFFSACLADCLKNHRDYTAGGGRYNPHGLPLTNFAVLADSLLAIKKLCFEKKRHSLAELLAAVRADWKGYEGLRSEAMAAPRFGDDNGESNVLARRVLDDIHDHARDLKNERGGPFQIGLYSYRDVIDWAKLTRATPDGRRAGDFLSQGLTPSRRDRPIEITSTLNSAAALDLSRCPAGSVLTVSLPLGGVNRQALAALERVFAASGVCMLQLNCVDKTQLLDARQHPEKYPDLVVRLYGYSARFVNLTPEMRDEFISRNLYGKIA